MSASVPKITFARFKRDLIHILEYNGTFVVAAVFFRIALEIAYRLYVVPVGGYWGFVWEPTSIDYIESWCIYMALVLIGPTTFGKPSDLFVIVLLFEFLAPALVLHGLSDPNRIHLYIILMGGILVYALRRGYPFRLPLLREGPFISKTILIAGISGVSTWFVITGAASYFQLDLKDVYEYRREVGSLINVGWMAYINEWAYNVFGPTLLAISLWRRSYVFTGIILMVHVFLFGVSSHRAVLFYPVLVIGLWFCFRFLRLRGLAIVPIGLSVVIAGGLVLSLMIDTNIVSTLFLRRVFFVYAANAFDYYEFFSNHAHVLWANSSITFGLVDYPYEIYPPARLIGAWRGQDNFVNNSFLSTGYMHAGIVGVIAYSVLAGLIFRVIDSVAYRGIHTWLATSVLVVPIRTMLVSADLLSSLLTVGILIGLVVLFLMRSYRFSGAKSRRLQQYEIRKA